MVQFSPYLQCQSVLYKQFYLLTAQSCIKEWPDVKSYGVLVGSDGLDFYNESKLSKVCRLIKHNGYNNESGAHDIAILLLNHTHMLSSESVFTSATFLQTPGTAGMEAKLFNRFPGRLFDRLSNTVIDLSKIVKFVKHWKAFELKLLEILTSSACQHLYLNVCSARDQFCAVVQAKKDTTYCRNEIGASICKKPGSNLFDGQGCELLGIVTPGAC